MTDILYYVLLFFSYAFLGPLLTYMTAGVLKYELSHKKAVYIINSLITVVEGAAVAFVTAKDLFAGHEYIPDDIIQVSAGFLLFLVLVFSVGEKKIWRKLAVAFLATQIHTSMREMLSTVAYSLAGNASGASDHPYATVIADLAVLVLEIVIFVILDRIRQKNDNVPLQLSVMLIFWLFLMLINSFFPYYGEEDDYFPFSGPLAFQRIGIVASVILGLILVFIFFYIRVTRKERDDLKGLNEANEKIVAAQTGYFEARINADTKIRAIRHDMKNNVQVLSLLLENGEYDKMREYLEQMGNDLRSTDISAHTGDTVADAIIAEKQQKAKEAGFDLTVTGTVSGLEIKPVDMCRILANILDNAIEAASDPALMALPKEEKKIELVFKKTERFFMISLGNPCAAAPVIRDGSIDTSKSDKKSHGFGLMNVRSAAAAYGGEMSLSCEDTPFGHLFRTEILFPAARAE